MISPRRHKSFEVVPCVGSISPTRSSLVTNLVPCVVAAPFGETKGKEDDNVAFRFVAFEQASTLFFSPLLFSLSFFLNYSVVAQSRTICIINRRMITSIVM